MLDEGRREEFFPACGEVSLDQLGGKVEVRGWVEDRIRLVSTSRGAGGQLRVATSRRGNRLTVTVQRSGRRFWGATEEQVDLELWVPRATSLSVDSGSGPVVVGGIHGRVEIDSGSGDVAVHDVNGSLTLEAGSGAIQVENCEGGGKLETGSGPISVTGLRGRLELETGCGDIRVSGVTGDLKLETGSGRLRVESLRGDLTLEGGTGGVVLQDLAVRRLTVELGSGDLEVEGYPPEGARWSVETGSGNVKLAIPESAGCAVSVETGGGGIDCRLPVEARESGPRTLKGVLNRTGGLIQVSTGSGAVTLAALAGEWPAPEPESGQQDESWLSVLRMVEEGKITPAEAEALLAALADAPGTPGEAEAVAEDGGEAEAEEEGGGACCSAPRR